MATKNVSTMSQFLNALETASDEDIIEVLADLNWDDVVDDINNTTYLGGTASTSHPINVTVNGNNHTIYNLDRSFSTASAIFTIRAGSTGFRVNNLSYLNCHLSGNTAFRIWSCASSYAEFFGGVIQGRFAGCPFVGYCTVKNFMMTFDHSKGQLVMGQSTNQTIFQNCWVKFNDYTYMPSSSAHVASDCHQCYFEGDINYDSVNLSGTMFFRMNSCCINIKTNLPSTPTLNNLIQAHPGSETLPTIVNYEKITPSYEHYSTAMIIFVDDDQMHNAEYLANAGFDIIP